MGRLLHRWALEPVSAISPNKGDADMSGTAYTCSVFGGFVEQRIYWICSSVVQGTC